MRPIVNKAPYSLLIKLCMLFAISCFANHAISAQVYKWVDENGNVHYTDKRPNNTESESIKIRNSSSAQRSSAQSQAKAIDEKAARALQAQQDTAREEAREKEVKEKCATMRENLKVMAETSRIRVNEDGNIRYLSPEEIEEKKAHHRAKIEEFCQ